jgi:hypothetical protein
MSIDQPYRDEKGRFIKGRVLPEEMLARRRRKLPWNKGLSPSEETRIKISKSLSGRKRLDISISMKEQWASGKRKKTPLSDITKEKLRQINLGKKHSEKTKTKMKENNGRYWLGKKRPDISGENCYNWRGGTTKENLLLRRSAEFKRWRERVFERDNWMCQKTKVNGCTLHPHHIKNFAEHPELRFDIDNGITLSEESHKLFHKIYGRKNNNVEQLKEFLEKN